MWREPLEQLASGFLVVDQSTDLNQLSDELAEAGWFVARCDLSVANDKATLINAIATSMNFPAWTGRNWDALHDAITDLDWIPNSSVVIVVEGLTAFRASSSAEWQTARDVLIEAAEWWQDYEKTLIVLTV